MSFTVKWFLPPILLAILAYNAGPHNHPNVIQYALAAIAAVWYLAGARATRLYWRGRMLSRGARDGWAKRNW